MFDMSLLSLTVTLRGVSNKHCLLPFFHSIRASCQLLAKEWALNTGKLALGGMPRNSMVK